MQCHHDLRVAPSRLTLPAAPSPASVVLTENYYPDASEIARRVAAMLGRNDIQTDGIPELERQPHDVPGDWFSGPF